MTNISLSLFLKSQVYLSIKLIGTLVRYRFISRKIISNFKEFKVNLKLIVVQPLSSLD